MYVELHARSAFSFLEGATLPEELIARASELNMPAMAIVDRDGVYGAPRFHLAAKKAGIRAHVGAEVTAADGTRYPLLVESRAGYQNLCRLITRMKLRAKKGEGAATEDDLAEHAAGLICLTGGIEGPLWGGSAPGSRTANSKFQIPNSETRNPKPEPRIQDCRLQITDRLERLCGIFGRCNVYVELQRHFDRHEEARNQAAVDAARRLGLPLVATNGVCYSTPQQREILDVFTCLRNHCRLETAGRLLDANSERRVKSPEEMARLFADLPEAIAKTRELSSRLGFTLSDLGYEFPRYPTPPGVTQMEFLRQRTEEGALGRYGRGASSARAWRQIERELKLIEKLDLAGYFLIVWDIVRFCREQNILVQGRGSAANSAVCYSLGITAVDPVAMELLFERFLSEERGEWPDIDLDLPSGDQRERVIQHVYERYGQRGAAMTANVITYRGRSAAREVGKALGFEAETLDRLSSLVSAWEYRDEKDTLERQFRDAGCDIAQPRIRKFFELCLAVQDFPRHLGQHSGGMVVCQGRLDAVVPLEPATMPGRVVVQWDKEDCADLGIIKVDLLGLGMMAAIEESIELIRSGYGEEVDLAHLPADDPEVYAALQKADTVGLFQVESRAQMSCLPRLRPERFYDLVVEVAIIRPGPIVGKMVHPYLKRRQGREPVSYPHPALEPVLKRTLGVPLFQEQLLRMAMTVAGFTGGEAEELRRAMGFKRSEARMVEIEKKLRRGMEERGITGKAQDEIVQSITSFALYGFPESHAASFALLAYASAYLKCHYLAAFTAALLNNQPMGFYSPATIVKDAQRHGLRMRPIDVARSAWRCTLENVEGRIAVRVGMRYVKGLREAAVKALAEERERGRFTSIDDLARRVPELQKDELVALAEVGALNFIDGRHRRDALWQVERAARPGGPLLDAPTPAAPRLGTGDVGALLAAPRLGTLEGRRGAASSAPTSRPPAPLEPMTPEERLVADFQGTGLTVGPHPMAYRRSELRAQGIRAASDLARIPSGRHVRVAGGVIARQRPGTAKGFVFLSLEDETGIANAIITPDVYERNRVTVVQEQFLLVEGRLEKQDGVISVRAERVEPLSVTRAPTTSHDFH